MKPRADIAWQTREITAIGLTVDFLAGHALTEGTFELTSYLIQSAGPLLLGVWYGGKQNLEVFRAGFGPDQPVTFEPERKLWLCAQWALSQVGTVAPGAETVGLIQNPDGSLGHIYSSSKGTTTVAVALRSRNEDVLIKWQVETNERAAYRDAEQHFFASIVCR